MDKKLQKQIDNIFPIMMSDRLFLPYAVQFVDSKDEIGDPKIKWEEKELYDEPNSFPILYLNCKDISCHFLFNIYLNRNLKEFYIRLCSCPNPAMISNKEPFVSPLFTIEIPDNNLDEEKTADVLFNKYLEFTVIPWIKDYVKRNDINVNLEKEADWIIPGFNFDAVFFFTRSQAFLTKQKILCYINDYNGENKDSDFLPDERLVVVDIYEAFDKSEDYSYIVYGDYLYAICKSSITKAANDKIAKQLAYVDWSDLND